MKYFLKYSFLFICIFCFLTVGNTQQKNKKKAKITASKKAVTKKKKKSVKSSKKKNKKSNTKIKSNRNNYTANLNIETADLSKLIISNNIATPKLDTIPEKEVSIISAFKPQLKNIAKLNFTKDSSSSRKNVEKKSLTDAICQAF
jgi:hypothetical protein